MNKMQEMVVFMGVVNVMNYMTEILQPIPLDALREWIKSTNKIPLETKHQEVMRLFHVEVIEAYIKAREYAQTNADQKIKNN